MQHQKGFTLIELIIVIVILGILAVTAAPKFIDIQKDAKASTVKAVQGALNSATSIVYGKALIAGENSGAGSVDINGATVTLINGYPDAAYDLKLLLDIDGEMEADFAAGATTGTVGTGAAAGNPGAQRSALVFYGADASTFDFSDLDTGCLILYTQATENNAPSVVSYTGGCN